MERRPGLSDDYVRALAEGRDGSLWVGTSRGLNRIRNGKLEASYTSADGLPSDSILSLLEDRDGSLWAGTYTAGLLRLRDGKVVAHYDNASGMPGSNQVRALEQAPDGTIWIGTTRGLVRMRNGATASSAPGTDCRASSSWRCTWPATAACGGHRERGGASSASTQRIDASKVGDAQDVFDFHEDADGTIWMASDRGLLRYRDGKLQALGLAQGLPIDTLFAVVDDGVGGLWLTSNRGVMRVRRSDIDAVFAGRAKTLSPTISAKPTASPARNATAAYPSALLDQAGKV